jgi:hypothetical protein
MNKLKINWKGSTCVGLFFGILESKLGGLRVAPELCEEIKPVNYFSGKLKNIIY